MNIKGEKIKALIESYSKEKGYPQRAHIVKFCEDFNLNYRQYSAYVAETQPVGLKIVYDLIRIFPKLNLNWLFNNVGEMFLRHENEKENEVYTNTEEEEASIEAILKEIKGLREILKSK